MMEQREIIPRPYRRKESRVGEFGYNRYGSKYTIIDYNGCMDITIRFDDGFTLKSTYSNFQKGEIKSPFDKSVHGVGYIGLEDYYKYDGIKLGKTRSYTTWTDMMKRCYSENSVVKDPTYADCTVAEEWHNYKNFKEWFDENYYEVGGEQMHLDKDILFEDNKVYCKERCMFIPSKINIMFRPNLKSKHGKLPTGVNMSGKYRYQASVNDNLTKEKIYSKTTDTPQEARAYYIEMKRDYIKRVAEHYKDRIQEVLYNTLIKKSETYVEGLD